MKSSNRSNSNKLYSYPAGPPLMAIITVLMLVFWLAWALFDFARSLAGTGLALNRALLALLGQVITIVLAGVIWGNWQPNLEVSDEGLLVQAFFLWKIMVPWHKILDLRETYIPWGRKMGKYVVVERFTVFHRLLGMLYCATTKPVIPIQRSIGKYDELIGEITRRMGQENPGPTDSRPE